MKTCHRLPLLVLAITAAQFASAIVIRHDRDDKRYVELAKGYDAICTVAGDGHGTLIAPQWILTAAHVTETVNPFNRFVTFGKTKYRIAAIHAHPTVSTLPLNQRWDLSLIKLDRPVDGIRPIPLYTMGDENGRVVTFVGAGDTGDGKSGPNRNDGLWRAARNKISAAQTNKLEFVFDAPPAGEDLEGISGPGDSGGPAFIEEEGKRYIAGISSYNSGRGMPTCTYGTTEHYARASTAREWIESTIKADPKTAEEASIVEFGELPKFNSLTGIIAEYLEAFNSGDPAKVEDFNLKNRGPGFLQDTNPEGRLRSAKDLIDRLGKLSPKQASVRPSGAIAVLVRSSKTSNWHCFEFQPAVVAGKLGGIYVSQAEGPPER